MEFSLNKPEDNKVQALSAQLADKDQRLQTLMAQVAQDEKQEQVLRMQLASLDAQLREITSSKVWRMGMLLRRIRVRVIPVGSRRERLLRILWHGMRILRAQGLGALFRQSLERMVRKAPGDNFIIDGERKDLKKSLRSYQPVPGLSEVLREKARRIEKSGFFDFEWYFNNNPEVLDKGFNPIEHYLMYGMHEEHNNPNPLFNTSLYAKWSGLPKEDALLHFVENGHLYAPGAYRNAEILLTAQWRYQENLNMECVKDNRIDNRKYAVYFQCGSGSIHEKWLNGSGIDWDLLVNHYDQTYVNKISCDVEFIQTGAQPGTKFTSFNQLLTIRPNMIDSYRYIMLLDDDIFMNEKDISLLFKTAEEKDLDLTQASLSADSHYAHPVFKNSGERGLRYVNGVEIMMPVISQSLLKLGSHLFSQSISGWGIDVALSRLVSAPYKVAVVDEVVAKHIKPINVEAGTFYEMLHRAYIYPEIELTHLQRIYGVDRSFYKVKQK
jgi:hypothetical protein